MQTSTRWTIAIMAVIAALVVALVMQLGESPAPVGAPLGSEEPVSTDREHRESDTPEVLAAARRHAELADCPVGAGNTTLAAGPEQLRGVLVECAANGATVDTARALAGRRVVLNLWAHWCGPCADELPAMAEYQQRVGRDVLVVTVHQDMNEEAGLLRLAELGVRLPTFQDGQRRIAAALRVPNVMPATVVLRPDGSVAQILPRAFASADEIAAAVESVQ